VNAPVRRLAMLVGALFASLLVSTTLIQYVFAADLNARADNRRTLLSTYARDRGDILVGQTPIATSEPSDDEFKFQRIYAEGPLYAHVTGFYSFYGASGGLEQAENALLSGSSDKLFYRRVSDLFTGRKAQGANIETTLDPAVQEAAARGLDGVEGAAVALDPSTGAVLALVSRPTYDPNSVSGHDLGEVETRYSALNEDPEKPLVDRAIGGDLYPPGSVFKVVTAAAGLTSGEVTPDSVLPGGAFLELPQTDATLPNHDDVPCSPTGEVTLTEAMVVSCNPAFGQLGMDMGASVLQEQAARFGFGDAVSVPMPVTPSSVPSEMNEPQLAQASIGQYDVRVTPMQMAMVAAAVGNNGRVMKPYLDQSVIGSDLSVIESSGETELSEAVPSEVAGQLRDMMVEVVQRGTGTQAQIPGVEVAGKTGTAEHGTGREAHAWFIAFAPADDPEIAVAVIVEDAAAPGSEISGGQVAGPIARQMMEARLNE
jgi:peptidoglycan glycosyltransferase